MQSYDRERREAPLRSTRSGPGTEAHACGLLPREAMGKTWRDGRGRRPHNTEYTLRVHSSLS